MIRRVYVDGYKSLRKVELHLQPLTVIVGPNAVGKSNLFDALRLLSRIVTTRSLTDAFTDHRGDPLEAFDYSEGGLVYLLKQPEARFTIEVDVELSNAITERVEEQIQKYRATPEQGQEKPRKVTERYLRYRIEVAIAPETGVLRVIDERLEALTVSSDGHLRPDKRRQPFLERVGEKLRLRMEGQARPTEYEVGLNYAIVSLPVYPPHYPHLIAFREELSCWQFYYFEPRLMREESAVKEVYHISPTGADLAAFYYTLKRVNPKQFDNLQRVLRLLVPGVEGIEPELTEEGKVRLKIRERGGDFSAKVISEGTLRLLGFMAILSPTNPASVIGFEEPENGVHPRRLKQIADILQNAAGYRQILVNTHSPLLPDYLEKAQLVRCRKEKGHSLFEPVEYDVGLFRRPSIDKALEEPESASLSQQLLRGDWE